jgi:hypothetical protein
VETATQGTSVRSAMREDALPKEFGPQRMFAASFPDKSVLIREVLPRICSSKSNSTRDEAMKATEYLAAGIGKAHERQLSTHEERRQEELKRIEQKRRTLPRGAGQASWSRKSFMRPEYLEPCRKYAMGSC